MPRTKTSRRCSASPGWALLLLALTLTATHAQETDFAGWLAAFKLEARAAGISAATVERTCQGLAPLPAVLDLDRRQAGKGAGFERYLRRTLPNSRIAQGRTRLARHRALLDRIAAEYKVPPQYIVALWGIESDFGRNTGRTPVVRALATLAHGSRRKDLFRQELLDALRMLDEGQVLPDRLVGSWAGAMGQCQFMPSTFRRHAVDHDQDGRRDIWGSLEDALASIASYLASLGWQEDQTWGRQVLLPQGLGEQLLAGQQLLPLPRWRELGVRRSDGGELPARDLEAGLALPDGPTGHAYLAYGNYRRLKEWNRSTYFALTVGLFADRLSR